MKTTLVLVFFPTLTLAHLERSLFSLSRQTVLPEKLLFFDNNTPFSPEAIHRVIADHFSLKHWALYHAKHGNPMRQLSWGNNAAIRMAETEVVILVRADIIYDFTFCERVSAAYADEAMSYVAAWMWFMNDTSNLEKLSWRTNPQKLLTNIKYGARMERAVHIDGASFCTSKTAMAAGGWYDEELAEWGFNQQDLQTQMTRAGVKMKTIPECLSFHMFHPGDRDMDRAKREWQHSSRRVPDILAEEKRLASK